MLRGHINPVSTVVAFSRDAKYSADFFYAFTLTMHQMIHPESHPSIICWFPHVLASLRVNRCYLKTTKVSPLGVNCADY